MGIGHHHIPESHGTRLARQVAAQTIADAVAAYRLPDQPDRRERRTALNHLCSAPIFTTSLD